MTTSPQHYFTLHKINNSNQFDDREKPKQLIHLHDESETSTRKKQNKPNQHRVIFGIMGCGPSQNKPQDGTMESPKPLPMAAGVSMSEATRNDNNAGRGGTFTNATELRKQAKEQAKQQPDDPSPELDTFAKATTMGRAFRHGGPHKG